VVRQKEEFEDELGIKYAKLDELLTEADFITIHTNLTPDTHHLIGERQFDRMKKTSVLVNTARGSIVDNMALHKALRNGNIGAAALDVTEPEPLPEDHPLLNLENVIITPHIASASTVTRSKMALMAVQNVLDCMEGKIPRNIVNPEVIEQIRRRSNKT
jgi:glyoxylate reductase